MAIDDVIPGASNPSKFGRASPILVLGVLMLTLSFFDGVFNIKLPGIIRIFAILVIVVGVIHSALNQL